MQLEFQRSILHHFIHQKLCICMNAVPKKQNNILMLKFTQQVHLILKFNQTWLLAPNNYNHYGETIRVKIYQITSNSFSASCSPPRNLLTAAWMSLLNWALYTHPNLPSPRAVCSWKLLVAATNDWYSMTATNPFLPTDLKEGNLAIIGPQDSPFAGSTL